MAASAAFAPITYRYQHHLFEIDPDNHPEWRASTEVWHLQGKEVQPPARLRVDGDELPELPEGLQKSESYQWIPAAIEATILGEIGQYLNRPARSVTISRGLDGAVHFEGVGISGRRVRLDDAAQLTLQALFEGVTDIMLPVEELPATVTVHAPELKEKGIHEVISVGESDFRGSPANRQHNISVGLARFNGHLVEQGETFSFNEVLGPVHAGTGYRQELVIKGDKTLPDYGGGLCQVSTTAYRGMWEYGFPIDQRINHSYSVRYYSPEGTDATIYPPYKDVKFTNDSPSAVLMQTHVEDGRAYFIYYGTKDNRESELVGPFIWGRTGVPADRVEYTTDIPPGTSRKVGDRVPGLKAAWFRLLKKDNAEEYAIEPSYSSYEARPRYTQIGVTSEELAAPENTEAPEDAAVQSNEAAVQEEPANNFRRWTERIRYRRD